MYYEAIDHKKRVVESAEAAARLINMGSVMGYDAICWTANGRELCCVGDGGINSTWSEVAVLDLTNQCQVESITFAWCELDEQIAMLKGCETGDFVMSRAGTLTISINGSGLTKKAWFACGCCGIDFKSTIEQQKKYDQDNGYGYCSVECGAY